MTETRVTAPGSAGTGSGTGAGSQAPPGRSLRIVMLVLAFACGASVANLYYAQPLLGLIRHSFGISSGTAALVVTLTVMGRRERRTRDLIALEESGMLDARRHNDTTGQRGRGHG